MPVATARDVSNNKNRPLVMNGEKLVVKDDAVALALAGTIVVDGSGVTQPISATTLPLPTGAASEVTLASVDSALAGTLVVDGSAVTQPISATALPLPSGAATDAYQINANTSLSSIDGALAGTLVVDGSGVTQPISASALPLPSGAATESNQNTANTSLSAIESSLAGTISVSSGVSRTSSALKTSASVTAGDVTSAIDANNYSKIAIYGSSSDNAQQIIIQASDDATNWYETDSYVYANATSGDYYYKFDACARYYRVKYNSTATETTRYSMLA